MRHLNIPGPTGVFRCTPTEHKYVESQKVSFMLSTLVIFCEKCGHTMEMNLTDSGTVKEGTAL